ncbi:MAG: triacylglycerol lipase, partial [Ruminococcus sp.]|nr:triacylglycerol lipase [Ruminococcus sp.]
MSIVITVLLTLFVLTAIILDLKGVLRLGSSVGLFLGLSVVPHEIMIFGVLFYKLESYGIHEGFRIAWICITVLFTAYWFTRLHIKPYCGKLPVKLRHSVLYGGGRILKYCAVSCVIQILFYITAFINNFWGLPKWLIITDSIFTLIAVFLYVLNGTLRIMFLCYRLNIVKRVLYLLLLPIPVVNIFILTSMAHLAQVEYDYAVYKMECENQRAESQVCKTKYPLLLVHGIGFRDFKYFNYWGRIPKSLIKKGATVYYG